MALTNKNDPKPFVELTEAAKKELLDIADAFERSKGDIEAFEEVGVLSPKLKSMVEMGEKMLKVINKRFI